MVSTLPTLFPFSVTGRRSNRATDDHRQPVLQTIEDYVDRFSGGSINGHACILRAICEATEVPLYADNMVAHMINAMLIPVNMLDKFYRTQNDYIEAQHHGQYDQDCTRYYNDCDVSMFKVCRSMMMKKTASGLSDIEN